MSYEIRGNNELINNGVRLNKSTIREVDYYGYNTVIELTTILISCTFVKKRTKI